MTSQQNSKRNIKFHVKAKIISQEQEQSAVNGLQFTKLGHNSYFLFEIDYLF